jgi:hypothetical protein
MAKNAVLCMLGHRFQKLLQLHRRQALQVARVPLEAQGWKLCKVSKGVQQLRLREQQW